MNFINQYGSIRECERETGISVGKIQLMRDKDQFYKSRHLYIKERKDLVQTLIM